MASRKDTITFQFDNTDDASDLTFDIRPETQGVVEGVRQRLNANNLSPSGIHFLRLKGDMLVDQSTKISLGHVSLGHVSLGRGRKSIWSQLTQASVISKWLSKPDSPFQASAFDYRISRIRGLQKRLPELVATGANVLILGPGMSDWLVGEQYNQPKTSASEFKSQLANIVDSLREVYAVSVVFLFPATSREGATNKTLAEYEKSLVEIEDRFDNFALVKVNANDVPQTRDSVQSEIISRARQMVARPYFPKASFSEFPLIAPRMPISASVEQAGQNPLTDIPQPQATALWLSSNFAAIQEEEGGIDEGLVVVSKKMHLIGGRSFLERWLQLSLLLDLSASTAQGQHRVAIIGDSIRMRISDATGYGLAAYIHLKDHVNLLHNPHNCGNTKVSLDSLENWLDYRPDLIFINHGLHDCAVVPGTYEPFASHLKPQDYERNLRWITQTVRSRNVDLIWGYSTPVVEQWHAVVPDKGRPRRLMRRNQDIEVYNSIAQAVMDEFGFDTLDLYEPMKTAGIENLVLPDGVHLNDEGSTFVGLLVSNAIKTKLGIECT
jgi:lysophospholipase L1-like esterase